MPRYKTTDIDANALLTSVSVATVNERTDFIHDKVFANLPVDEERGSYFVFSRDDTLRTVAERRLPGTKAAEKHFDGVKQTYACDQWALKSILPVEDRNIAGSPLDDEAMVVLLTEDLLIRREKQFFTDYFTASVWETDKTGTTDFVKWDSGSSDLIGDVWGWREDIKKTCGRYPNVLAMTADVWRIVVNDEDVLERIKYTQAEPVSEELVARLLGVDELVIASAIENTAEEGATYSGSFIDSEKVGLFYREPAPAKKKPSAGYIFSWTMFDNVRAELAEGAGASIQTWFDDDHFGDWFRGMAYFDMNVVHTGCGLLAVDVIT